MKKSYAQIIQTIPEECIEDELYKALNYLEEFPPSTDKIGPYSQDTTNVLRYIQRSYYLDLVLAHQDLIPEDKMHILLDYLI